MDTLRGYSRYIQGAGISRTMWFLCETVDLSKLAPDGKVAALGPVAEYLLEKHNIEHVLLSTPLDENSFYEERGAYFLEELEWFNCFENWLTKKLSGFGITNPGLINAHYYQLVFLVDSLHVHSALLHNFIRKYSPDKICYLRSRQEKKSHSPYDLLINGNVLIQEISKELFTRNAIDFNFIETEKETESTGKSYSFSGGASGILKKSSKVFGLKPVYEYFKYQKIGRLLNLNKLLNKNFLVLNAGVLSMDLVIRELLKYSKAVYFKESCNIYEMHSSFSRKCFSINCDSQKSRLIADVFEKILEDLMSSDEVFSWLNKISFSTAKTILAPYFKYFLTSICVQNLIETEEISRFYKEKRIDFLMLRSSSEDFAISSLIAAKEKGIRRVVFQHGMSPLDWKLWHITELKLTDVYFTTDTMSERYFKEALKNDYAGDCHVSQASHYLNLLHSSTRRVKLKENLVIYVPSRGFWGFRCLNNMRYPLTWYFKLQKEIIDLLGRYQGLRAIFKLSLGQEWVEKTTVRYISDAGYKNISIRRDAFINYINSGARVLTDYPSSVLYEAASAGLPVISLCYNKLPVWAEANKFFGNSIQLFSTIEEAVKITNVFLDSHADRYIVKDLPFNNKPSFVKDLLSLEK